MKTQIEKKNDNFVQEKHRRRKKGTRSGGDMEEKKIVVWKIENSEGVAEKKKRQQNI